MAHKANLRRSDIDKTSYFWTRVCGACHPGGGPAEYDRKGNRYDVFSKQAKNGVEPRGENFLDGDYYRADWAESGVSEADCLMCHLKGYDWNARALMLRGGFFYAAPAAGAGWIRDLKVAKPSKPGMLPRATGFRIDYRRVRVADPGKLAALITKDVPEANCWNCHSRSDCMKRGRSLDPEKDVHQANGLSCTYCHPSGEDHEIAKGSVLVGSVRDDLDGTMKTCTDCHLKGADPDALQPEHPFPDLHLKKLTCEACHIPYKDVPARLVLDNATTGKTVSYRTSDFLSSDPLNPEKGEPGAPAGRWYPAFVWFRGRIKPVMPMQIVWWGDWDRKAHRVIPIFLWKIREMTGAAPENGFNVVNRELARALHGSREVNTPEEIKAYLRALSVARDRFGLPVVNYTPVLVKGGVLRYLEGDRLRQAPMPRENGGFTCCEPFDLSHDVVFTENALGASGCGDCHTSPSPFFNRKVLLDPFGEQGKPVYVEEWRLLGYSKERMEALTRPVRTGEERTKGEADTKP